MKNKLNYIHDCFLRNGISVQGNNFVFCEYLSSNLVEEKINQIYCYARYCSMNKKSIFFYNSRAGNKFGVSRTEFQNLIKLTNLLNNFNFEKYNRTSIFKLIYRYITGLIYG